MIFPLKKLMRITFVALLCQGTFARASEVDDSQESIIESHFGAIKKAFQNGVGVTLDSAESVTLVAGGFSKADLFKVKTSKGPFIVKIMKDSPEEDILTEFNAAKITGDAGVGPQLYYSDLETKTLVLGYIDNNNSINRHATPFHKLVAAKIRALHEATPLERDLLFFEILRQDAKRLVDLETVSPFLDESDIELYDKMAKEVEAIFKRFPEDIRPVHHDISPHNVLYKNGEAWLIDWETASNDYYPIDLCMFANFHIYDESLLPDFLEAYYGRKVTALERAKFDVIRPFCYAFHGFRLAFLSNLKTFPELGNIMEYKNFQLAIRRSEVDLGPPVSLFKLAVSTMTKSMNMLKGSEFKEGLKVLKSHLNSQETTR